MYDQLKRFIVGRAQRGHVGGGVLNFTKAFLNEMLASQAPVILMSPGCMTSNKGTGGMESSVVLFKPRILFACTHPSVSNVLDCNDWLAYKHQSTACVQTRLYYCSLLYTSISFQTVFQTCLDCGSLLRTRISIQLCVLNHVWIMVPCRCAIICLQPFD